MKRTILIVLCLAAVGTFAIVQAEGGIEAPDCETVDGECCCGGTVDCCEEDCDCDDCDSECEDCTGDDCDCDDCTSEEEFHHCGGCR
jgi:hypothetical protein